jgi:glycosyltransferase involved in cell wall biosynthesis
MSQGKPVIASRSGGMPDVVVDGSTGLLVPPEDADGLTCAMERVLGDSAWREELGRAGRARSANFRASTVVPRIERVYEDLWLRRRSAARDLGQGSSADGQAAVRAAAGDDGP